MHRGLNMKKIKTNKYGWYIDDPLCFQTMDAWKSTSAELKKRFPVQFFFRETVMDQFWAVYRSVRDIKYKVKNIIKPCHPRWRKHTPARWQYCDITGILEDGLPQLILDFWYEEARPEVSVVCWESEKGHIEFYAWLQSAVKTIETDMPELEKAISDLDLSSSSGIDQYKRLNTKLDNSKTDLLTNLIKYRGYMWT